MRVLDIRRGGLGNGDLRSQLSREILVFGRHSFRRLGCNLADRVFHAVCTDGDSLSQARLFASSNEQT